jgi:hypothetical protein
MGEHVFDICKGKRLNFIVSRVLRFYVVATQIYSHKSDQCRLHVVYVIDAAVMRRILPTLPLAAMPQFSTGITF